jgi:mannose/fructose/N-acetylgalactosamine-specific phosphotransferase system component IIC
MSAGPLRRIVAVIGLVALAPVAAMLVTGAITPEEAAIRALAVGLIVVILGNLVRQVVTAMLRRVERRAEDREVEDGSRSRESSHELGGIAATG